METFALPQQQGFQNVLQDNIYHQKAVLCMLIITLGNLNYWKVVTNHLNNKKHVCGVVT